MAGAEGNALATIDVNMKLTHVAFKDVTLKQKGPGGLKDVLKGVSAQIPVGTLTGVVGPASAGQGELFSMIYGTEVGFLEGRVPVQDRVALLTQDPGLLPSDTVDDIMWFYANLRMPREMTRVEKEQRIAFLLKTFGLTEDRDKYVGGMDWCINCPLAGGLTGGKRRRVQICVALLMEPTVVIMEQPVTSMDEQGALGVIKAMQIMRDVFGMTVIASFHEPKVSYLNQLDNIMLMSQGHIIYNGRMRDMMPYVQTQHRPVDMYENPSDYALEWLGMMCPGKASEAAALWSKTSEPVSEANTIEHAYKPRRGALFKTAHSPWFLARYIVLFKRAMRTTTYPWSKQFWWIRLNPPLSFGIITAVLAMQLDTEKSNYVPTFTKFAMLTVLSQVRMSTTNTIAMAQLVRATWFVERPKQLYGVVEHYFSWELGEVLWQTLFAMINYFTIWLIAGWGLYDDMGNLGQPFMVMSFVANGSRPLLATMIYSKRKFNTLFQVILMYPLMSILFGGRLIRKDLPPEWWRWLFYLNPFYYGFSGLMNTEYKGLHIDCSYASLSGCPTGDAVLAQYSVMEVSLTESNVTGFSLYVAYTISTFFIFRFFQGFLDLPWGRPMGDPARKIEHRPPLALPGERQSLSKAAGEQALVKGYGGYGSVGEGEAASHASLARAGEPPHIQYRNLTYREATPCGAGVTIVNNVSFDILPRDLVALVGMPGNGAKALLNILGAWKMPGELTATAVAEARPQVVGYVAQEDVFSPIESPREILMYAARFLHPGATPAARWHLVSEALELVGLTEPQFTLNGGPQMSGRPMAGLTPPQRRRLSIATALLKRPHVLVLDEPTKGLDCKPGMMVVQLLRKLAEERTVVALLVRPQYPVLKGFDRAMLVGKGQIVYNGAVDALAPAIEMALGRPVKPTINPADMLVDHVTSLDAAEVRALRRALPAVAVAPVAEPVPRYTGEEEELLTLHPPSGKPFSNTLPHLTRVWLCFTRTLRLFGRTPWFTALRVLQAFFIQVVIGITFLDATDNELSTSEVETWQGLLTFVFQITGFTSVMVLPYVQFYRKQYLREMSAGYYNSMELVSGLIILESFLWSSFESIGYSIIIYHMAGHRDGATYQVFNWFNLFIWMSTCKVSTVCVGLLFPDLPSATAFFLNVMLMPMLPANGIIIFTPQIYWPQRILVYLNPLHYSIAAEMLNQFDESHLFQDDARPWRNPNVTQGDWVMDQLDFDTLTGDKWQNVYIVLAMGVIAYVLFMLMPCIRTLERRMDTGS